MLEYLRSGDPILIREGLQWASRSGLALEALPAGIQLDPATVDSGLDTCRENIPDKIGVSNALAGYDGYFETLVR